VVFDKDRAGDYVRVRIKYAKIKGNGFYFVVGNLIVLEVDGLGRVGPHGESPYNLVGRRLYSKTPLAKGKERIGGFGNKGAFEGTGLLFILLKTR
jgi:hypothetical protein